MGRVVQVVLLVGLVVGGGCDDGVRSLTLELAGLPGGDGELVVDLSSPDFAFEGTDQTVGAVAVSYPGDGGIRIRTALVNGLSNVRLGVRAAGDRRLTGHASASIAGRTYVADAATTVSRGADARLRFQFSVDGGVTLDDGGALPDATVTVTDAKVTDAAIATDAAVATDATISDGAVANQDLLSGCSVAWKLPGSVVSVDTGPAIAYHGGTDRWGVAWAQKGANLALLFSSLDEQGARQATDVDVVPAVTKVEYGTPQLAPLRAQLALAYGHRDAVSGGDTYPALLLIDPSSGKPTVGPTAAAKVIDSTAPFVGGIVVRDDGSSASVVAAARYATASRTAVAARFDGLAAPPTLLGTPTVSTSASSVTVAWVPTSARFGFAYLDPVAGTAWVAPFTGGLAPDGAPFQIGKTNVIQSSVNPGPSVSVAGFGAQLAVAFVAACTTCMTNREVHVATYMTDGTLVAGPVLASDPSPVAKHFPQIAFDGTGLVVAWRESDGSQNNAVKLRRLSTSLLPIGAPLEVSRGPVATTLGLSLAVKAAGEYAVAVPYAAAPVEVSRVSCP